MSYIKQPIEYLFRKSISLEKIFHTEFLILFLISIQRLMFSAFHRKKREKKYKRFYFNIQNIRYSNGACTCTILSSYNNYRYFQINLFPLFNHCVVLIICIRWNITPVQTEFNHFC